MIVIGYWYILWNMDSFKSKKKKKISLVDEKTRIPKFYETDFLNGAGEIEPLPTYIFIISPKNQYINGSSGAICRLLSLPIWKLRTLAHNV